MKKLFAVTHGKKYEGANPNLSPAGVEEIRKLKGKLPPSIPGVIVGTGARFSHTLEVLDGEKGKIENFQGHPIKFSSLLGNADSGTKSESGWDVVLADGTKVKAENYIGPLDVGIDLWPFLDSVEDGTLLVTGREFIGTLIKPADGKSATLYEIDVESRTITEL